MCLDTVVLRLRIFIMTLLYWQLWRGCDWTARYQTSYLFPGRDPEGCCEFSLILLSA